MKKLLPLIISLVVFTVILINDLSSFLGVGFFVPVLAILIFGALFLFLNQNASQTRFWPLMIVLGACMSFFLADGIDRWQRFSRKRNAERVIQSIYQYKKENGYFPESLNQMKEQTVPTLYLGFTQVRISYVKQGPSFIINYQNGPACFMSYSSTTQEWTSFTEWAGS